MLPRQELGRALGGGNRAGASGVQVVSGDWGTARLAGRPDSSPPAAKRSRADRRAAVKSLAQTGMRWDAEGVRGAAP